MGRRVPAVAARRPRRGGTPRRPLGQPGEPVRLRPDSRQADDRRPPAGGDNRQRADPSGHDRGAARRPGRRAGPYRHRAGVGLLRCWRNRIDAGRTGIRQCPRGRRADFIGNPDLAHTYSYVPDIAAGLATLGTDDRAIDGVWHLPGPETVTTRRSSNSWPPRSDTRSVSVRCPSWPAALGLVNPMMRALAEMAYEFDEPFVLDTTKYQAVFRRPPEPRSATPSPPPSPGIGIGSMRPVTIDSPSPRPSSPDLPETERKEHKP